MLTTNQRDLLAIAITDRYILPGESVDKWVDIFLEVREMVEMCAIERENNVQEETETEKSVGE